MQCRKVDNTQLKSQKYEFFNFQTTVFKINNQQKKLKQSCCCLCLYYDVISYDRAIETQTKFLLSYLIFKLITNPVAVKTLIIFFFT